MRILIGVRRGKPAPLKLISIQKNYYLVFLQDFIFLFFTRKNKNYKLSKKICKRIFARGFNDIIAETLINIPLNIFN